MKKQFSISYKWALILVVMIITLLSVGLLINKAFFNKYYLYKEKEDMFTFAQKLDKQVSVDDFNQCINDFVVRKQASVNVYSETDHYAFSYSVFAQGHMRGQGMGNRKNIKLPHGVEVDLSKEGYVFFEFEHDDIRTQLLALVYQLESGDVLLVSMPIESINRTADIAIQFNVYIVLILLTVAVGIIVSLSKRMTRPIIQLSHMTKKISELDFSESYSGSGNDEIHELGENINSMSKSLEQTMSNLKEANDQLLSDIQEKEKNVAMRKSLIANISHELKTPIALVMSYAEGLEVNEDLDEDKKAYYLKVISKEADHMDNLVRDLLDLSELEYDASELDLALFDISSSIDEVIDRYAYLIKEKSLKLNLDKEDIVMVQADKKRVEQALTNLIINAIEHTPKEGYISLAIDDTDQLKVLVKNSGSQIPEEDRDKIWHSFYKSKKLKDRRIGGSGIGLSIVRAIMDKHKGFYGCYNDDNQAVFYIGFKKTTGT